MDPHTSSTIPASAPPRIRHVIATLLTMLFFGFMIWAGRQVDPETLEAWKNNSHPMVFFSALVLLPLAGVPLTPFYLLMGAAYGIPLSLLAALVALVLNLLISYGVVKLGLGPLLKRLLKKAGYSIPEQSPRRELRFALILRLIPAMPNFVKNYVLALSGVSFKVFFFTSLLLSYLYALPLILLGDSVFDQNPRHLALAAGLLLLLGLLTWWLRTKLRVSASTGVSD